ncbi:uncharacterized protein [Nicotiana tomentosiformis]|uniref:uncharacterized protein n=1 Tax=Nicotiana tomentosiformis TaxID=4098 RepID=UPI00388CBF7C
MVNYEIKDGRVTSVVNGVKVPFDKKELGEILGVPAEGHNDYKKLKWPSLENLPTSLAITRKFGDNEEELEPEAIYKSEMKPPHKVMSEFLLDRVLNGAKTHGIPYGFILMVVLAHFKVPIKKWEVGTSKDHFGANTLTACDYEVQTTPKESGSSKKVPANSKVGSNHTKGFNRRTLSIEEMNDKRVIGMCYFCNEKYVPGHKCKNSKQIYVLEVEEIDEGRDIEEGGIEHTNRYRGSHNFIDPDLVHHLGCKIRSTTPQMVDVANGNMMVDRMYTITWLLQGDEFSAEFLLLPLGSCGVVLGVQWLLTLGDIKMNFRKLTMEFWYKGRNNLLRGAGNQVKVQEARKIAKHTGITSQLCMIQVVPMESASEQWHALKAKEEPKIDVRLTQLLSEYSKLFEEPTELPPSRGVFDHRIVLQCGTEPVNKRPYRYPSMKKDIIEGLVHQMLDQCIIQPSCSPFASPVVLVGENDGTWRLCVDYRDLNKHIVKNKFPIPIVEDLLDKLGGSRIFSNIHLRSGYHQLRMANEDVPKTAFRTHSGHFEYMVMPFGLSNVPAAFQGLMNSVFHKFLRKHVLVFFDDVLIYSSTMEDHLVHLRSVFVEMMKHQLFAKRSKYFFGVHKIEYLGHFVTAEGVSTDPHKIEVVRNWPTPTTLKQLRRFLGLAGYYRRFIKGFGVICKPLTELPRRTISNGHQ